MWAKGPNLLHRINVKIIWAPSWCWRSWQWWFNRFYLRLRNAASASGRQKILALFVNGSSSNKRVRLFGRAAKLPEIELTRDHFARIASLMVETIWRPTQDEVRDTQGRSGTCFWATSVWYRTSTKEPLTEFLENSIDWWYLLNLP